MLKKTTLFASMLLAANVATAGVVTNDTDILSAADHEQLSTWLGEDVDLTRIFAKGIDGTTSQDWHAAVDNQGSALTLLEVFNGTDRHIAGGYNKFSWSAGWNTNLSTDNFLFNLSSGIKYQKNNTDEYQAYGGSTHGITMGGGHDIFVRNDLTTGYTGLGYSYGERSRFVDADYRAEFMGSYSTWTIGKYETFTLSPPTGDLIIAVSLSDVSIHSAMGSLVMLGLGFGASRRRKIE